MNSGRTEIYSGTSRTMDCVMVEVLSGCVESKIIILSCTFNLAQCVVQISRQHMRLQIDTTRNSCKGFQV